MESKIRGTTGSDQDAPVIGPKPIQEVTLIDFQIVSYSLHFYDSFPLV